MVTCYDPDAPTVSGFWHWAMYDIPADVLSLPLNAGDKGGAGMPAGAKMLLNDAGFAGSLGASNPRPSNPKTPQPYPYPNRTLALTCAQAPSAPLTLVPLYPNPSPTLTPCQPWP